jgi:integrase
MGSVFRKTVTRPLPAGAEFFTKKGERWARWKDRRGKTRTAAVTMGQDGRDRIVEVAATYTAKFRDGQGILKEVSTGCREEATARSVLGEHLRRAELVRSKVITVGQNEIAKHQEIPLSEIIELYIASMGNRQKSPARIKTTRTRLLQSAAACGFRTLPDLNADKLDAWLASHRGTQGDATAGRSASVINGYVEVWNAFGNWCTGKRMVGKRWRMTGDKRLIENPFAGLSRADEDADPRRKRRAMTVAELQRLLVTALCRPLAEYGRQTQRKKAGEAKRKRDTWTTAPLVFDDLGAAVERARVRLAKRPEFIAKLEALGRERQLIYKMLVLTGLRKSELASITVGQLQLDGRHPFVELKAADEKNRQGSQLPLRSDLVEDLRSWLAHKADRESTQAISFARHVGHEMTNVPKLPLSTKLFVIADKLVSIFNRDLAAAGIPKRDDRGRTLDVHALRTTFCTLLAKGGVAPRTAQAAARHGDISLTMGSYTDPALLDVAGALDVLPPLTVGTSLEDSLQVSALFGATGTSRVNSGARLVAPTVAPALDHPRPALTFVGHASRHAGGEDSCEDFATKNVVSGDIDTKKGSLTIAVREPLEVGATGFEPATSTSRT